jgi:hypothetical protein
MQEAVHMVDEQALVICSDSMTYVSMTQGQVLRDEQETDKKMRYYHGISKLSKKIQRSLSGTILLPRLYQHHIQEIKEQGLR